MQTPVHLEAIQACVIIPSYNNERTLQRVLDEVLSLVDEKRVIVINDGSTDSTASILANYQSRIQVLANEENSGKGFSLRKGFKHAFENGFQYAITIDSDGQHYPKDIQKLVQAVIDNPGNVVMGSRNMEQEGVPGKSSFGNRFSNFWFFVETGIKLPDTQTGFRAYPLAPISKMRLFTTKFELEIEVIVRLAWKGIGFTPVSIDVKYDPEERVSHFRPARDFFRISVLNTVLFTLTLLYFLPKRLLSVKTLKAIKAEALKPQESNARKASSIAFGVFMGIVPLWGFQLLIGIPLAILLRLNKVLFVAAANISIPPNIPFILTGSLITGQFLFGQPVDLGIWKNLTLEGVKDNLLHYAVGAVVFACVMAAISYVATFAFLKLTRKQK